VGSVNVPLAWWAFRHLRDYGVTAHGTPALYELAHALVLYTNEDPHLGAWPSRQKLADELGVSEATVKRRIQELCATGAVAVHLQAAPVEGKQEGRRSNRYTFPGFLATLGVGSDPPQERGPNPPNLRVTRERTRGPQPVADSPEMRVTRERTRDPQPVGVAGHGALVAGHHVASRTSA
jgi:DNA binding protein with HTH domain